MKYLILLAFILPIKLFAQNDSLPKNEEGIIEYKDIVTVESATADQLYSRGKLFVAQNFKSGKEVTQMNDDAGKQIVGNGTLAVTFRALGSVHPGGFVSYRLTIQCKEGKYRFTIKEFTHDGVGNLNDGGPLEKEGVKNIFKKDWKGIKDQTNTKILKLISALKNYMSGKSVATQGW